MKDKLLKFGGSSVSTSANINKVADIIIDQYIARTHGYLGVETLDGYCPVTVVVSALGQTPGSKEKR